MKRSLIILAAFALFFGVWYFNLGVKPLKGLLGNSSTAHYTLNYLISGLIPAAALLLLHKRRDIFRELGISKGFISGLLFALLCTLPMLVGYALIGSCSADINADRILTRVFIAGFFEELIFRGFVFGQLFRCARWGFLPAALLTALAFGALHLYQGHDLLSALGAFAVTALGSIFFSWIYVEWNYNLWAAIWLHTLMNLPWIVFTISTTGAVGGIVPNILRGCTLLLAIGLTILYKRRFRLPYFINCKTLIINA